MLRYDGSPGRGFGWSLAERELGYRARRPASTSAGTAPTASAPQGPGDEDRPLTGRRFNGRRAKTYTYDDLRLPLEHHRRLPARPRASRPASAICLFMDRVPELAIGFLGILKTRAIAKAMFSAFGDESLFVR
ncbi:MAG: hypothetical protein MZW92_60485, partial [Comamonadaceae bacterium]|nr:hypothetical protein [Comamonadaceae bacterium]